jgi:flagellar M-ring protein FliF
VPLRVQAESQAAALPPERQKIQQQKAHAQNVFEQVAESVRSDPAQSTRLLESWIRSE